MTTGGQGLGIYPLSPHPCHRAGVLSQSLPESEPLQLVEGPLSPSSASCRIDVNPAIERLAPHVQPSGFPRLSAFLLPLCNQRPIHCLVPPAQSE